MEDDFQSVVQGDFFVVDAEGGWSFFGGPGEQGCTCSGSEDDDRQQGDDSQVALHFGLLVCCGRCRLRMMSDRGLNLNGINAAPIVSEISV
ncbi:hypothetical protein ES703_76522 [subsurface metagenome]